MKTLKQLLWRTLSLVTKFTLMALPLVASSWYFYRAGRQDSVRDFHELAEVADNAATLLERQGKVIERMRGEINVLALLASARTGAGFPTFPLPESEKEEERGSETAKLWLQPTVSPKKTTGFTKNLTTRN